MKKNWILSVICFLGILTIFLSEANATVSSRDGTTEKKQETSLKQKGSQESKKKDKASKEDEVFHYEVIVTATRTEKDTFEIPNPVNVVNQEKIAEQAPNTITELFFELPGVGQKHLEKQSKKLVE